MPWTYIKKCDSATMDVYIRSLLQVQIPCTCIYVLTKVNFCFNWSFVSVYCSRWKQYSFFFHCTTTHEQPGNRKISFREDLYICPWSLSHDFCMYIPNICGRSDKMCLALKGLRIKSTKKKQYKML